MMQLPALFLYSKTTAMVLFSSVAIALRVMPAFSGDRDSSVREQGEVSLEKENNRPSEESAPVRSGSSPKNVKFNSLKSTEDLISYQLGSVGAALEVGSEFHPRK